MTSPDDEKTALLRTFTEADVAHTGSTAIVSAHTNDNR
jgi:hypothetical protein